MAYCPHCGKPAGNEATKCIACGKPLQNPAAGRGGFKGTLMIGASPAGSPGNPPSTGEGTPGSPPAVTPKPASTPPPAGAQSGGGAPARQAAANQPA
ncbi:MAG: hypothetical protein OXU20_16055, partial [Myxococcales bacterium]|nr:hypothetical protein [Myxococcales bacterium]